MNSWKKCWGYIPIDFGMKIGTLENITQKIRMKLHTEAGQLQIRFTNKYNAAPLTIEHAAIGKWTNGNITENHDIYCQGKTAIQIPAGDSLLSDVIELQTHVTDEVVISLYFKEKHDTFQICQTWNAGSWTSSFDEGDTVSDASWGEKNTLDIFPLLRGDVNRCAAETGISAVLAYTDQSVKELACFGDSITHMSYYFDPLSEALAEKYKGRILTQNCGIGGNRVLYDACFAEEVPGNGHCFGKAGIQRFDGDVFGDTIPDIIFLMEGVNDCTHGLCFHIEEEVPGGGELFEGIKKIVSTAHEKGSKVYISTIMPFGCLEENFREQAEEIRQQTNELIRQNKGIADGFVDLDKIVRDSNNIHVMRDGLHLGDGVHPNAAGGKVIAKAIMDTFALDEKVWGRE